LLSSYPRALRLSWERTDQFLAYAETLSVGTISFGVKILTMTIPDITHTKIMAPQRAGRALLCYETTHAGMDATITFAAGTGS